MASNDYDSLFDQAGRQYNVDPRLLKTIYNIESTANPGTKDSSAGAQGGMQLMPDTAAYLGVKDPKDMTQAVPGAARYVAEGLAKTGTPEGALAYYFAGPDPANQGPKTAAYVAKAQSLYPQMTVAAAAPAPAQTAVAPQPSSDFSSRWGIAPPANDAGAPSGDFAARWGIAPAEPAAAAPAATPQPVAAPPAPNTPASTDRYAGWDVPNAPAAAPAAPVGGLLSYQGLTNALQPAPNTTYGSIIPLAQDNATGAYRLAMPTGMRDLAQGAVDLAEGPTTGAVTPKATAALTTMVPGLMPSPAAGTGAVLAAAGGDATAPTSYLDRSNIANAGQVRDIANQNQLQADAPLSPEFKANPGVTAPQTVTQGAPAEANPLAAVTPVRPPNPLSTNAAAPAAATTPPAAPGPTAPASEAAEYAAIPDKLPPAPLLPPLTQAAADARADDLINHFSTRGGVSPTPPNLVPGFVPTLAQKTADPGLATLERGVQSMNPGPFQLRAEANQKVLQDFTHNLTGAPEDIAAAQSAREATTGPMRDAAFANTTPVDASPIEGTINGILAGPDGKRAAVQGTMNDVLKSLHVGGDMSAPLEDDPQMLYGARKNINDLLDPVAQRDKPALQQAARQLMTVRDALDDTIEDGAPGFKNYISAFADQSKPIDAMRYMQSLNLTDANGNLSLPSVDRAVKAIEKQRAQPGVQKSSGVSDDQLADLTQLRDTLRTQGASATGKALGSNTFQNLATNSQVGTVTGNPLVSLGMAGAGGLVGGPIGAMAGTALNMGAHSVTNNAEAMTKSAIIERLLNLNGKGDAAFAPKGAATGPRWRGQPIPTMTVRPNPLSGATP